MHAGWREGHEAGSERAGAGSLTPLGRLGVGEGEESWGRGGVVTATAGEGGAGDQGCGLALPGTVLCRLGGPLLASWCPCGQAQTLTQEQKSRQRTLLSFHSQTWARWYL